MPKVSVIVPIYNVEKYIERCAVSLFEQTLDDIEYVFVNDCTPDRSMEILHEVRDRYPNRKPQVKIINMDKNSGQAAVRNKGLENVTGEYVIHCDSDDWVELDIYEKLYNKSISTGADIVVCDFFHEFHGQQRIEHFEPITSPFDCIEYDKKPVWWSSCNRLVKKTLILDYNIVFVHELNLLEDLCYMMRLYFYANKIEYVNIALYHYNRINESSITHTICIDLNKDIEQQVICYKYLDSFFAKNNAKFSILTKSKINIRDGIIRNKNHFRLWEETFPEVVPYVLSDKSLSWAYRRCYAMASKGFYLPFKIYRCLSRLKS